MEFPIIVLFIFIYIKHGETIHICSIGDCECEETKITCRDKDPQWYDIERNRKYTNLDFKYCAIEYISPGYFDNFEKLEKVDIRYQSRYFDCRSLPIKPSYELLSDCITPTKTTPFNKAPTIHPTFSWSTFRTTKFFLTETSTKSHIPTFTSIVSTLSTLNSPKITNKHNSTLIVTKNPIFRSTLASSTKGLTKPRLPIGSSQETTQKYNPTHEVSGNLVFTSTSDYSTMTSNDLQISIHQDNIHSSPSTKNNNFFYSSTFFIDDNTTEHPNTANMRKGTNNVVLVVTSIVMSLITVSILCTLTVLYTMKRRRTQNQMNRLTFSNEIYLADLNYDNVDQQMLDDASAEPPQVLESGMMEDNEGSNDSQA